MKLSVTSIANGLVRVAAEGEITVRDFQAEARDPLAVLLGDKWPTQKVIVDMSGVTFVDSSAVGWLITWRRQFERGGGMIVLHSVQPRVRQVLDMLKVGRVVPLVASEAAAVSLATPPSATPAVPPAPAKPQAMSKPAPDKTADSYDVKPAEKPSKPSKRRGNKAA